MTVPADALAAAATVRPGAVEILARLMAQMRADPGGFPAARMTQLISLCRRLGMTAKSRASLDPIVPVAAGEDPFEGFPR